MDKSNEIYSIIKNRIVTQQYTSRMKMNQSALAKEFNVSRTLVINALIKLSADGLLDTVKQKGFFVHDVSIKELSELFILREVIEDIAARDLAEKITKKQVQILGCYFENPPKYDNIEDYYHWYSAEDMKFHNSIIEFCSNTTIKKLNESIQLLNRTFIVGLLRNPADTVGEHHEIVQAFGERDSKKVSTLIKKHLGETKNYLLNMLEQIENIGLDPNSITIDGFRNLIKSDVDTHKN
ncbi:MAG: GntR family transcriptional regulator [Brevinema sp.]